MDEGQPISYLELSHHVPVFASDGTEVGSLHHVVAAPHEDIFHGIVMKGQDRLCFIAADDIASLHEHGVDLKLDRAAAASAPEPHGAAPAWHDREPGVKPSTWKHILGMFTGADPRSINWTKES
ncbi:MAG: hypothetical protein ACLP8S_07710 [Solirubrobacteraceae bacterium]